MQLIITFTKVLRKSWCAFLEWSQGVCYVIFIVWGLGDWKFSAVHEWTNSCVWGVLRILGFLCYDFVWVSFCLALIYFKLAVERRWWKVRTILLFAYLRAVIISDEAPNKCFGIILEFWVVEVLPAFIVLLISTLLLNLPIFALCCVKIFTRWQEFLFDFSII